MASLSFPHLGMKRRHLIFGSSNHICSNLNFFNIFKETTSCPPIYQQDGDTKRVTHPVHRLHSVSKLTCNSKVDVIFIESCCVVQDLQAKKMLAIGRMMGNLYILDPSNCLIDFSTLLSCTSTSNVSSPCNSFQDTSYRPTTHLPCTVDKHNDKVIYSISNFMELCHHASTIALKHIPFFPICNDNHFPACDICYKSKHHRLPFFVNHSVTNKPFELLHIDIWVLKGLSQFWCSLHFH